VTALQIREATRTAFTMATSNPSVATSNPRKFAEKIALHTQKGAEETAEFKKIMAECAAVMAARVSRHCLHFMVQEYCRDFFSIMSSD
jgi:hypothetical protein